MEASECILRWNGFNQNLARSFGSFGTEDSFSDVTLACDGHKAIKAHKIILSACSPGYFAV